MQNIGTEQLDLGEYALKEEMHLQIDIDNDKDIECSLNIKMRF